MAATDPAVCLWCGKEMAAARALAGTVCADCIPELLAEIRARLKELDAPSPVDIRQVGARPRPRSFTDR
jgi:hypothetical protein